MRKVQKWGNSLAVRLPIKLARRLMFDEGDVVEVTLEDDAIVIRKSSKPTGLAVDVSAKSKGISTANIVITNSFDPVHQP
jgi:antitoxin component of MazEF toxin-antitoxin module